MQCEVETLFPECLLLSRQLPQETREIPHLTGHDNFILSSEITPGICFNVMELLQLFFWLRRSGVLSLYHVVILNALHKTRQQ